MAMTSEHSGYALMHFQNALVVIQSEWTRPSVVYRPALSMEGNQYMFLLGEDIQSGIAGFGQTPAAAAADFDVAFYREAKGL